MVQVDETHFVELELTLTESGRAFRQNLTYISDR